MMQEQIDAAFAEIEDKWNGFTAFQLAKMLMEQQHEICQILGKALGYPWYKDDQENFPGATEADGVCVGDNVAESMAAEAASFIAKYRPLILNLVSGYEELEKSRG